VVTWGIQEDAVALYSVWDWNRNAWAIYRTRTPVSVGDDALPPRPRTGPIGADPDTQSKPLPAGAKFVEYSHVARGEVRRKPSHLVDLGDDAGRGSGGGVGMFVLGAALATGAWYLLSRRSK